MRGYSIDLLISEINEVINHPDPETLRISTMLNVRYVLRLIGKEFTCDMVDERITVKEGRFQIPDDVVQIDDFGHINGKGRLSFRETPYEVIFPYFQTGDLIMRSYKLYKDEDGMPIIPADAYQACVHWCKYKAIDARGEKAGQIWRDRLIEKQLADREIYTARGLMNETTSASLRNLQINYNLRRR